MNNFYIKQSPLTGMVGYGGGATGLTFNAAAATMLWAGDRGLLGGGMEGGLVDKIDRLDLTSTANASDFGDLTLARNAPGAVSNMARGVFGGGEDGGSTTYVWNADYVTINNTSNATSFGNLTAKRRGPAGTSNGVRGLFSGGEPAAGHAGNTIDYITIQTTGNATDFGDLSATKYHGAGWNTATRSLHAGGGDTNTIEYVDFDTTGNATDLSDCTQNRTGTCGAGDITRMVINGDFGANGIIEYKEMETSADAVDFGDDLSSGRGFMGAMANATRTFFGGGYDHTSANDNTISSVVTQTLGNATDWGNTTSQRRLCGGCSGNAS